MEIIYVFNWRLPSEKTMAHLVMKTCEVFAKFGHRVTLLVPWRFNPIKKDPFDYHHIERNFEIKRLFSLDLIPFSIFGKWSFLIQSFTFGVSVFLYALFKTNRNTIFYSPEQIPCFFLSLIRPNFFYEIHDFPGEYKIYNIFFGHVKGVVVTNRWKIDEINRRFRFPPKKILHYPNAVDIEKFAIKIDRKTAREKLSLPQDKKLVVYTGHLFSWKGVETLALAAKYLNENIKIVFVGGTKGDQEKFKKFIINNKLKRVLILPHQDHNLIPFFLRAADVVVVPNTAREKISKFYTSPVKVFEYMASGRPIVASNLPSIRNILNKKNAVFFEPDDPQSLAMAIEKVLTNESLVEKITRQAQKDVLKYSWEKRVGSIIKFIEKLV